MARNGSGVHTIPNTFVSGNTITASGHNQNNSDISAEITNSVAADGQTSMTGPLKAANGSAAAPSVTFASDGDSGFYRKAANSVALSLEGVDRVVWSTANASFGIKLIASATASFVGAIVASATATFSAPILASATATFTLAPIVPAKSFAISKIADGTANRLYGTNGSGVATEVTPSTGLTLSAGTLTVTVAGSWVLINTYTPSAVASQNVTGFNSSLYSDYRIVFDHLAPATDAVALYIYTSADGSNFDSSSGNYAWSSYGIEAVGGVTNGNSNSDTQIVLTTSTAGNASNRTSTGELYLINPGATAFGNVLFRHAYTTGTGRFINVTGAGQRLTAAVIAGVQFLYSAGNIASGTIKLYGLRK